MFGDQDQDFGRGWRRQDLVDRHARSDARSPRSLRGDADAEADGRDAWAESANADVDVRELAREQGVNERDWHAVAKNLDGKRVVGGLGERRDQRLSLADQAQAWNEGPLRTFMGEEFADLESVKKSLNAFHHAAFEPRPLRSGLQFDGHGDTFTRILREAESASVGMFTMDSASMATELMAASDRVGDRLQMRFSGTSMSYVRDSLVSVVGLNAPANVSRSDGVTDHFKFIAADLDDPKRAVLAIGSVNATSAALGGLDRFGGRGTASSQIENMFVLRAGMVDDHVFADLVGQTQRMATWAMSGAETYRGPGAADVFAEGSTISSRVLTGAGVREVHERLLSSKGLTSAVIFNWNFGTDFLAEVRGALGRGAQVTLVHGARPVDGPGFGLTTDTKVKSVLDGWTETLSESERSRLTVVQDPTRLVHAKSSTFNVDGEAHLIQSDLNLDDGQYSGVSRGQSVRNAGLYLRESEYAGAGVDAQRALNLSVAMALRSVAPTGFSTMVGGNFEVGGRFTVDGVGIDLGIMKRLTALAPDAGRAFAGQVYVPELTKYIQPAVGALYADEAKGLGYEGKYPTLPGDVDALSVLDAGVRSLRAEIQEMLEGMAANVGGAHALRRLLQNPIARGALRAQVRARTRQVFENFQGVEPGVAAYDAKAHARLAFRMGDHGLEVGAGAHIDARSLVESIGAGASKNARSFIDVGNHWDYFFMAGGLSRFGSRGQSTPARLYDMAAFDTMPATARLGKNKNGQQEYMFLLAMGKLAQLPQRLQNIMSARNLTPETDPLVLEILGSGDVTDQTAYSRFVGNDGKRMKGIRMRGLMVPGMTGDNAYALGQQMETLYVGEESWSRTTRLQGHLVPEDTGRVLQESIRAVGKHAGGDKYVITADVLHDIQHRLAVGTERLGTGNHLRTIDVALGTDARGGGEHLVIDLKTGISVVQDGPGAVNVRLVGTPTRNPMSGDRTILKMKAPLAMVDENSRAIRGIQAWARGDGRDDGPSASIYRALGMDRMNVVFGAGVVKTGEAHIETGIEVLETGVWRDQLSYLKKRGLLGAGVKDFAGLITQLADQLSGPDAGRHGVKYELQQLAKDMGNGGDVEGQLRAQLELGQRYFGAGDRAVTSIAGRGRQHLSSAALAYAVHGAYYMDHFQQNPAALAGVFGDNQFALGAVPMSFVSAVSATAVAMSSRNRVNFLSYHAGKYADAFYDVMALSPKVKGQTAAYTELVAGGLFGKGNAEALVGWDFNPMTRFEMALGTKTVDGKTESTGVYERALGITNELRGLMHDGGNVDDAWARLEDVDKRRTALTAEVKGVLDGGVHLRTLGGNVVSAETHAFLGVQEKAGMGARTLFVPIVGELDGGGRFVANSGAQYDARYRVAQVHFLSPGALRSQGSFEDFSSEIEALQVRIERGMAVLEHLTIQGDGKVFNRMGAQEQQIYEQLMANIGALHGAQRAAAVTDLQKNLGGMLGLSGRNMVVGTLPEVKSGTMVLGANAWKAIKVGAVEEIIRGLEGSKNRHRTLRSLAETVGHVDVFDRHLSQLSANVTSRYDALNERLNHVDGERAQMTRLYNDLHQAASERAPLQRIQQLVDDLSVMEGRLGPLGTDSGRSVDHRRQRLEARRQRETRRVTGSLVRDVVNELLEDATARKALGVHGVFQRAGAPFGPEGIVVADIMTDGEYNDLNPSLKVYGALSKNAAFLSTDAMGRNLGDFDGDTGSITWLQEFARLTTMSLREADEGPLLSDRERRLLARSQDRLRWSQAEIDVEFARHITGWNHLFEDERLVFGADKEIRGRKGGDVDATRRYLHDLTERQGPLSDLEARLLSRWEQRKGAMKSLAHSVNEYVDAIHETASEAQGWVESRLGRGQNTTELLVEWSRSRAGAVGLERFKKSAKSLTDRGDGKAVTWNDLIGFFAMTTYASTTVIAKTFEVAYGMQAHADAVRAGGRMGVMGDVVGAGLMGAMGSEEAREVLRGIHDTGEARGFEAKFAAIDEVHARASGALLIMQQMAREAIKPKGDGDLIAEFRSKAGNGVGRDRAVGSGVDVADNQVRTKGLNAVHALMTGQTFRGDALDVGKLLIGNLGDKGQGTRSGLYEGIRRSYVDYWEGRVDSMFAAGAAGTERLKSVFGDDGPKHLVDVVQNTDEAVEKVKTLRGEKRLDDGSDHAKRQDLAHEAYKGAVEAHVKGKLQGDSIEHEAGIQYQKGLLKDYIEKRSGDQTSVLWSLAKSAAEGYQQKLAYVRALADGDVNVFRAVAGTMSGEDKLKVISQLSGRGKFSTPEAMERALLDIFSEFRDREDLKLKAMAATTTEFGERLAAIHEAVHSGADFASAFRAGAAKSRTALAIAEPELQKAMKKGMLTVGFTESDFVHAEGHERAGKERSAIELHDMVRQRSAEQRARGGSADPHLGVEDEDFKRTRVRLESARQHDEFARDFATGGMASSTFTETKQFRAPTVSEHGAVSQAVVAKAATSHFGSFALGAVAVASVVMGAAFQADASTMVGEMAGAAVAYANPAAVMRLHHGENRREQMVHAGIGIASLGIGLAATHAAEQKLGPWLRSGLGEEMLTATATASRGRQALGHVLGAGAGLVAGLGVGMLLTAMGQNLGWLSKPQGELGGDNAGTDGEASGAEVAGFAAAVDELLDMGEDVANGLIEVFNEAGERVHQEWYQFSWAALDASGEETPDGAPDVVDGGLDTFITGRDFDVLASAGAGDSIWADAAAA